MRINGVLNAKRVTLTRDVGVYSVILILVINDGKKCATTEIASICRFGFSSLHRAVIISIDNYQPYRLALER